MYKAYLGAALFSLLLVVAHIFGGGPEIHLPMLETGLSDELKAIWSVVWHGVSALLIVNTVLLFGAAWGRAWGQGAVMIVGLQYLGFTGLFIFYGLLRLGNITQLPQWTMFALVVVLIGIGLNRATAIRGAMP